MTVCQNLKFAILFSLFTFKIDVFASDFSFDNMFAVAGYTQDVVIMTEAALCGAECLNTGNDTLHSKILTKGVGLVAGASAGLILETMVKESGKTIAHQIGIDPKLGSLIATTTMICGSFFPLLCDQKKYEFANMRSPLISLTRLQMCILCGTIIGIVEILTTKAFVSLTH